MYLTKLHIYDNVSAAVLRVGVCIYCFELTLHPVFQEVVMRSYSALYYPFIHFKDDNWLKLSALYWDKMGRIVPYNYQTQDSGTVRELGGFVETLRPDWVRAEFGETFIEFVDRNGAALRERYDIAGRESWIPVPAAERPPAAGGMSGEDPRLGYVFYEKLSDDLRKTLVRSRLAVADLGDSRWIGMHPKLARVYMTALADQLAGERGLCPLTADAIDHIAMSGCTIERLGHALLGDVELVGKGANDHEVEGVAATVAMRTVFPRDISKVPVERILAFRDKHPGERASFQTLVENFIKPREWLKDVRHKDALTERLKSEFEKTLKPKIEELRAKLHEAKIDTVYGCFNVKAVLPDVAPTALGAMGIGLDPIMSVAGGFAWGAFPVFRDQRKKMREALRSAEVSYLYQMERDLTPQTMVGRIKTGMEKFLFGV
jgi:hypothetical protein